MPSASSKPPPNPVLLFGDDDFEIKQRARSLFQAWCQECGGFDHEIIDAQAGNGSEALAAIQKLREALQTLPFFGSTRVIWFQNCNFLGDDRTASSSLVTENLGALSQELKSQPWDNVRLLISAGKVDKRKIFFKTLDKIGTTEHFAGLSLDDRNWTLQAERLAQRFFENAQKKIARDALALLVASVGPNTRQLASEAEKIMLYAGSRNLIRQEDVEAVVSKNKQSRAFALGDALGERHLGKLLRTLDEELWTMKTDSQKSEIGLLYLLISKVRGMILIKEMEALGWIRPERDYNRFKAQLERAAAGPLPEDARYNPLAMNPYVLFKASEHAGRYSGAELARAMELLLQCNQRLIFSELDESLVLQQALIQIVKGQPGEVAS